MLQDTLLIIKKIVKESNLLTELEIDEFLKLMKFYDKDDNVYPGVIMANLNISGDKTYKLLEILKNNSILRNAYEVYCHKCNQFQGQIYESFYQIPDKMFCRECNEALTFENNIIVLYRVN